MARGPAVTRVDHGGAPAGWLDFSANTNPVGVPASVRAAIASAGYERYSDLDASTAERYLAADAGVPRTATLLTAGATEALRLIAAGCLGPAVRAVIVGPTYGEYARLAALAGAGVDELRASAPRFRPPVAAIGRALRDGETVVFLCDPNNPTGQALTASEYRSLLAALTDKTADSSLLVIDQSFAPFANTQPPSRELIATGRVLLVRSLTKLLAIPGVRVGYVLGRPHLLNGLARPRDPWPVAAHALAAARAASWRLDPLARRLVSAWRGTLVDGLRARGLRPCRSATNFVLVEVGPSAARVAADVAAYRVAIRSCAGFGLRDHIRLAVRPPNEQVRLFAALDRVLPTRPQRGTR